MKKLFCSLLFGILFVQLAFAACLTQNHTIFRISDQTNAHAEEYNGAGNYAEEICWVDALGTNRVCAPGNANLVLALSAATNAHVEQNDQGNYPINVCFGNLQCDNKANCDAGESCIASISAATNAHASSLCSGIGSYPIKICCAVPSAGPTELRIVSFVLEPNSVVATAAGRTVTALAKARNSGGTDATVTVKIELKDQQGNTKASKTFSPTIVAASTTVGFNFPFTVDNSWAQGTYTATASLEESAKLKDRATAYLTITQVQSAVSETNWIMSLIIALLAIAIICSSSKRKK